MICNKCICRMYASAMSSGECENCKEHVTTSHMPCDKLCDKCSKELNKCQACGNPITESK